MTSPNFGLFSKFLFTNRNVYFKSIIKKILPRLKLVSTLFTNYTLANTTIEHARIFSAPKRIYRGSWAGTELGRPAKVIVQHSNWHTNHFGPETGLKAAKRYKGGRDGSFLTSIFHKVKYRRELAISRRALNALLYCKFSAECARERISKIGQHLGEDMEDCFMR